MFVAQRCGADMRIGRDGTSLELEMFESKFRQDQSRTIQYRMPKVFGRELLDLYFIIQKFDLGKKFSRYALKTVIKEAGLEREDREMVNAALIWKIWDRRHSDPKEWEKTKRYCEGDALDTLAIWDMVGDAYFYSAQCLAMTFERCCMSASGAQINLMFIRAYLADGHSIPKPDEKKPFQGAISMGFPGVYKNSLSLDINSLYPSVIIQYSVYDKRKDPKAYMLYMVKFFREQRLIYKQKAKEDPIYVALDGVAKGFLNSFYGANSTSGLHFNSQECAELITRKGRETLEFAIKWATGNSYEELLRLHDKKQNKHL
jgi:DNA polymerase elongation subunit (family B)